MNFTSAYIYGFGKWQDYQIDFSGKQFVVITGENESGKSSLRNFIMFMLYGLPPKQRTFYQPKTGGKMGGRLTISTEAYGHFTIERIHDRNNGEVTCYLSDGTTCGESWLRDRLNGIDKKTFTSIFSFDSTELARLHHLDAEELGEVLLGIGMTGTEKIYAIEKELDNQLNALFKPQGKKPEINQQIEEMEHLNEQLKLLQRKEKAYKEKQISEKKLLEEINKIQKDVDEISSKKEKQERKLDNYSFIQEYYYLHKEYRELPNIVRFPEQGLERYQANKGKIKPLESELAVLDDTYRNYENEITNLKSKLIHDDVFQTVEQLVNKRAEYNELSRQQEFKYNAIKQLKEEIINELNQLKIGMKLDDLSSIEFPFHIEDTWSMLRKESENLSLENEKVTNESLSLQQHQDQLLDEKKQLSSQLLESEELEEIRSKINAKKYTDQVQATNKLRTDKQKVLKNAWNKKNKTSFYIFISCVFLSLLIITLGFLTNSTVLYTVGLIVAAIGIVQNLTVKYAKRLMDNFTEQERNLTSDTVVDENEYSRLKNIVQTQEKLQMDLAQCESKIHQVRIEALKLEERKEFFKQRTEILEKKVQEQVASYPFLQKVTIEYWSKLYHNLHISLDKYAKLVEYQHDTNRIKKQLIDYEAEIESFMEQQGWFDLQAPINQKWNDLQEVIGTQTKLNNQLEQYYVWIKQVDEKRRELINRMKPYETEIRSLWDVAKVNNEEDYIRKATIKKQIDKAKSRINVLAEQLKAVVSHSDLKALASGQAINQWDLEKEYEKHVLELKEKNQILKQKRQDLSDIKSLLLRMEESEDYSIMLHQYHLGMERLNKKAKQWAILQTAKQKLLYTKQVYQENYLPNVLERATYYFDQLTNGKYKRVYPPELNNPIQVESNYGLRYLVTELSQGTKDQLYISLRIALCELMNETKRLPFLIDDAFVHFDIARREKMLQILLHLSKKQQVLLFSCDERIRDFANQQGVQMEEI